MLRMKSLVTFISSSMKLKKRLLNRHIQNLSLKHKHHFKNPHRIQMVFFHLCKIIKYYKINSGKIFKFSQDQEGSSSISEQIQDLDNEIVQLKEIHRDFFEYYKEYAEEENRFKFSRTLQGKFLKKLAWAVSLYCVYKMLMSIINFIIGRRKSMDPINRILKIILPFIGFTLDQETYETLSIYGTFVFMGSF